MSTRLFLTCSAVSLASLGIGFAAGRVSKPDGVVTQLVLDSRDSRTDAAPRVPEVVLAESGSSRIAVIEPVASTVVEPREPTVEEALASLDRAVRKRPIGDGSDAEFERKYRGVSLAAAREAMLLLSAQAEELQAAVIKMRMAQGPFEERHPNDGQAPPFAQRTGGPGSMTLSIWQTIDAGGEPVTRFTTFDSVDYPSLHAAQMELQYLQGMMRVPFKSAARSPK